MSLIKTYTGRVPACGCFCGSCPVYTREKKPCPGANDTARCEHCKSFHLCCQSRGITHCHQCARFPCSRFRNFRNSWLKYGADLLQNQALLKEKGEEGFLADWNQKTLAEGSS